MMNSTSRSDGTQAASIGIHPPMPSLDPGRYAVHIVSEVDVHPSMELSEMVRAHPAISPARIQRAHVIVELSWIPERQNDETPCPRLGVGVSKRV